MYERHAQLIVFCLFALGLCSHRAHRASAQGQIGLEPNDTAAKPGSFRELLNLHSIPKRKPWRTHQASGYDRDGGFYDSGNFLRVEDNRRYVLMETEGPGCIDRMWFTYKKPMGQEPYTLLVYVDDDTSAVIDTDLDRLFSGDHPPFVQPLSGVCGLPKQPGRFSYVPIGFMRSCKVVLQPSASQDRYNYRQNNAGRKIPHVYYQITFRKFEQGARVKPFSWDMDADDRQAFEQLSRRLKDCGKSPWDGFGHPRRFSGRIQLDPGKKTTLFRDTFGGVIYSIRIGLNEPQQVQLQMTWDGAAEPQVMTPLGPFFACNDQQLPGGDVRGLWAGYAQGHYYCYLPMPFRKQASISLVSRAAHPQPVEYEVLLQPGSVSKDQGWFCAHHYDYDPPLEGKPYEVLSVRGAGHVVGIVMDRPGHMEGDDRFYIDGERYPSIHGTGTEDFFNFAWGLSHTGAMPLHGITIHNGRPVAYRFHVPAAIPFSKSANIMWEHGHDHVEGANLDRSHYSGIVMYYLHPDSISP